MMGAVEQLPELIIMELLSRLPIPDVLPFRCVSKTWKSLIDHLLIYTKNLSFIATSEYRLFRLPLFDLLFQTHQPNQREIDLCFDASPVFVEFLLTTCNGLICFQSLQMGLFLLDTVAEELKKLPNLCKPVFCRCGSSFYVWGFGFNSETQEYKLVRIMPFSSRCDSCRNGGDSGENMGVVVHAVGSDSWRTVSQVPPRIFKGDSVQAIVNGAFHWQGTRGGVGDDCYSLKIISFSIVDEVFDEMPYPESYDRDCKIDALGVMGEKLCLMRSSSSDHGNIEIWVMEEYGVVNSWNRKIAIRDSIMADSVIQSKPLRILPNALFLALCGGEKIVFYDPKSDIARTLTVPCIKKWYEALICG
ncbi:hypothetical protein Syun_009736 [Stephania yunnanensis]|uniref:F-box domain-containing protein n=1 Tax=Stephania yunnanensis TaxID=152371 RepID=A0AAP0KHK1_9MAGN